jgi:hypothetical protein
MRLSSLLLYNFHWMRPYPVLGAICTRFGTIHATAITEGRDHMRCRRLSVGWCLLTALALMLAMPAGAVLGAGYYLKRSMQGGGGRRRRRDRRSPGRAPASWRTGREAGRAAASVGGRLGGRPGAAGGARHSRRSGRAGTIPGADVEPAWCRLFPLSPGENRVSRLTLGAILWHNKARQIPA